MDKIGGELSSILKHNGFCVKSAQAPKCADCQYQSSLKPIVADTLGRLDTAVNMF